MTHLLSAALLLGSIACTHSSGSPDRKNVIVVGHRGASGYRPEHTLASYELAIEMGADYIEPDLVITKDGVLIARHENEISSTTDVAQKFPKRKKTKTIDGVSVTGWFSEDFTLKEIKTLRAKERLASRDQSFNFQFSIPSFNEIIALAKKRSSETNREIGIFPETKHPTYFSSIKLPLEPALAKELEKAGWNKFDSPVIIQSFELDSLRKMRELGDWRLVFLYDDPKVRPYDNVVAKDPKTYGDYAQPEELKNLSGLLYGIGPHKGYLAKTNLTQEAHRAGLKVIPYTFRSDAAYLAKEYHGDPTLEYHQFFKLGIDGVFSDFPDHAVKARMLKGREEK